MIPVENHPTATSSLDELELGVLLGELTELRADVVAREAGCERALAALPEENRASARNLVHYLALRSHDLSSFQEALSRHGLSSLGRAESHVLWSLAAVLRLLRSLAPDAAPDEAGEAGETKALSPEAARELLAERTRGLLGAEPGDRGVRIMVTMPTEAATDYPLVRDLLDAGMNCMRINCAHDGVDAWERMVANLRRAERELGRSCRVLMDIPGPRVRTGPVEPGPRVVKLRPRRDVLGWVVAPVEVWLTPTESPEEPSVPADARLPLPAAFLAELSVGDRLRFRDTRGSKRTLRVVGVEGRSRRARLANTAYVATGTRMVLRHPKSGSDRREARVGPLPPVEQVLYLREGDTLVLTDDRVEGRLAGPDAPGGGTEPARIGCTPPEALGRVRAGDRIWFDDGKIGGVVRAVREEQVVVEITSASPAGDRLRAGKGINLPDTPLEMPSLTAQDLVYLPFIARHADLVGYSFVRSAEDVRALQDRLAEAGRPDIGIVLKVETCQAFDRLPSILLAGMHSPVVGVMIARGDLAVECGFARLAEVQEEILWLCEAAHVPVVWATQVLEKLAKKGRPTRAEVTDAAVSERAECVMLNKGPYVVEAVRALDSILKRMQRHQEKKKPMLRRLHLADRFFEGHDAPAQPPPEPRAAGPAAGR